MAEALTVVALSNPILDSPSLSEIRDFGPVLVGVGAGTEGTAGSLSTGVPGAVGGGLIRVGVGLSALHDGNGLD